MDEFLQDAEGLVTLGLARSSSQLSFRVNCLLNASFVLYSKTLLLQESAHEESEFSESGSRAGPETTNQEEEEEEQVDEGKSNRIWIDIFKLI